MFFSTRFVYIHIPRTGGTTLTDSFGCLTYVSKCVHHHKHDTAREIKTLVGSGLWDNAYKFTVMRNPVEICKSWFRHCVQYQPGGFETGDWVGYCQYLREIAWRGFVEQEVLTGRFVRKGGFLATYCNLPDIAVLSLPNAWQYLTGVTGHNPPQPRIGETRRLPIDGYEEAIMDHCHLDPTT